MAAQETYDVRESAAFLKIHPETVRGLIRTGELAAVKIGRRYVIRRSVLDAYLAAKENDAVQASPPSRSELCRNEKTVRNTGCTTETALGILTSGRQAAKELDALLAPKTAQKPKSYLNN